MIRYFSSLPVFDQPSALVDRENGIIKSVIVAKVGLAKGHNVKIDRRFLQQIVDQANARPQGIKARFGHPNACSTALGTYLGRFKNYSYHSDLVKADLHLDDTARKAPSGNLYDYVLDMAEKNPDMFGASIAFQSDQFEELEIEENGKKKKEKFFRLKELRATDIVDDPAATDGLFSAETLPAQATQFLDENPELAEFIFFKPERIIEFLNNYLNNTDMSFTDQVKSRFRQVFNIESDVKALSEISADEEINEPEKPVEPEKPSAQEIPVENSGQELDNPNTEAEPETVPESPLVALVNGAFAGFLEANPDPAILPDADGNYHLMDAVKPENSYQMEPVHMLSYMLKAFADLTASYKTAIESIQVLTDRLNAKPTIPNGVTDPQVKVDIAETVTDKTGFQILSNIPADLKTKLKRQSNS
jgi:hypothetical protein